MVATAIKNIWKLTAQLYGERAYTEHISAIT